MCRYSSMVRGGRKISTVSMSCRCRPRLPETGVTKSWEGLPSAPSEEEPRPLSLARCTSSAVLRRREDPLGGAGGASSSGPGPTSLGPASMPSDVSRLVASDTPQKRRMPRACAASAELGTKTIPRPRPFHRPRATDSLEDSSGDSLESSTATWQMPAGMPTLLEAATSSASEGRIRCNWLFSPSGDALEGLDGLQSLDSSLRSGLPTVAEAATTWKGVSLPSSLTWPCTRYLTSSTAGLVRSSISFLS
mmetsp:Transcript_24741/g.35527  ORF Transcript_24741/g.35527 Transcript_24741/m.35527 type:complete len:249 (-) Transcript_24741:678-1424(-)